MGEAEVADNAGLVAAADWLYDWLWWQRLGPGDETREWFLDRLRGRESDRVEFRFRWVGALTYADGSCGDWEAAVIVVVRPDGIAIAVPDRGGGHEFHCAWQSPTAPDRSMPPSGAP
jgi:hypothetical protein